MFSFKELLLDKEQLILWRKELYKTNANGYIVLKEFIPPKYIEHMRRFWLYNVDASKSFQNITGKEEFKLGCPNLLN